jgi:hypothetical protein
MRALMTENNRIRVHERHLFCRVPSASELKILHLLQGDGLCTLLTFTEVIRNHGGVCAVELNHNLHGNLSITATRLRESGAGD